MEESLKSVNLFHGGVGNKQAGKYSGGMKRRLSVAISLIGNPKVRVNFCVIYDSILMCEFLKFFCLLLTCYGLIPGIFVRLFIWMNRVLG